MKLSSHHFLFLALLPVALLLSGCEKPEEETAVDPYYWEPEWGPNPYATDGSGAATTIGPDGEEIVIRDTAYRVIEKRQAGGELVPSGTSRFDGGTVYSRTPLESMIIVEGNQTGTRSAYLLPPEDYIKVQVGHNLQESTLDRWESSSENHIPADAGKSSMSRRTGEIGKRSTKR